MNILLKNLVNAVKQRHGLEYYVRGTYTHKNLDFTKDVLAMSDLGFEHLSMEPVVGEVVIMYFVKKIGQLLKRNMKS